MTQQPWGQQPPAQQAPWGQQPPAQQAPWGQQPPAQQPAPVGPPAEDPFAIGKKTPAVSFKDAPIGAKVVLTITDHAKQLQQHNFETGELDFWEASPAEKAAGKQIGNPKMAAVVNGIVVSGPGVGEERSIWAAMQSKAGSMCAAIADAQRVAGERIAPGGILTVELVGEEPPENPRLSPRKLYRATYAKPGPGSTGDAFAQQAQQAPPPQWAQQAPQQQGYNAGGQLPPGQGYVQNTTSQPEPVQAPPQAPWGGHEQQAPPQAPPAAAPPSNPWG